MEHPRPRKKPERFLEAKLRQMEADGVPFYEAKKKMLKLGFLDEDISWVIGNNEYSPNEPDIQKEEPEYVTAQKRYLKSLAKTEKIYIYISERSFGGAFPAFFWIIQQIEAAYVVALYRIVGLWAVEGYFAVFLLPLATVGRIIAEIYLPQINATEYRATILLAATWLSIALAGWIIARVSWFAWRDRHYQGEHRLSFFAVIQPVLFFALLLSFVEPFSHAFSWSDFLKSFMV